MFCQWSVAMYNPCTSSIASRRQGMDDSTCTCAIASEKPLIDVVLACPVFLPHSALSIPLICPVSFTHEPQFLHQAKAPKTMVLEEPHTVARRGPGVQLSKDRGMGSLLLDMLYRMTLLVLVLTASLCGYVTVARWFD